MEDIIRQLNAMGYEFKANEVMHTTNAGKGQELIPTAVLQQEVFDAVPMYSTFVGSLPGFHGTGMQKFEEKAIIGDAGFFGPNTEWTTGSATPNNPTGRAVPTDKVELKQKPYIMEIAISRDELNYSIGQIQSMVTEKMKKSMARTVEGLIINGDPDTGITNVNKEGVAPDPVNDADHAYYLNINGNGLRATALDNADVHSVGTADFDDLITVQDGLGDYSSDPTSCLWLFNKSTHSKFLSVNEFADESRNGKGSTVHTGAITNILGSDVFIARDMLKAQNTGLVSATPASNTTGQFLYFWKPSVQYGYGVDMELVVTKVPGKGVLLTATFDIAVTVLDKQALQTDPSVFMGIGVTL